MEDADGLSFDFEGGLDAGPLLPTTSVPVAPPENSSSAAVNVAPSYDHSTSTMVVAGRGRSFRQTVCRHWLRGLCMEGDACGIMADRYARKPVILIGTASVYSWSEKRQDAKFLPGTQIVFFILNVILALGVVLTFKPFLAITQQ